MTTVVGDVRRRPVALHAAQTWIRFAAPLLLAGLLAGALVLGIGSRLAMRLAGFLADDSAVGLRTANGNRIGETTLDGTLSLFVFGSVVGLLPAAAYGVLRPVLPTARRWRVVVVAAVVTAALGRALVDPGNIDFRLLQPRLLNVAMFAVMAPLLGAAVVVLHDRLDAWFGTCGSVGDTIRRYAVPVIASVVLFPLLVVHTLGWILTLVHPERAPFVAEPPPTLRLVVRVGLSVVTVAGLAWFVAAVVEVL